ncbi:uncharacterized protein LOC118187501 [Stegodyphus dumicola]|uniref:uncharacterized protein LOC118187501 n=1 Tax=Stegodyphus dumicola TaxID=202533 RepID=UPI0015B005F4|nr:uncharacterized protein LOC118187501 [Stegodyphus dumicola]
MDATNPSLPDEMIQANTEETGNQQNPENKPWSKVTDKDESVSLECTVSPNIESFVEQLPPSQTQLNYFRQNCMHGKKKMRIDDDDDDCDSMGTSAQNITDDCDAFCKFVAMKLRQMTKMQKTMAQRLISEICFRGEMQMLQMNTIIGNNAPIYQQNLPQCTYASRHPHLNQAFGKNQDYILVHQQAFRHVNPVSATPGTSCPNYMPQQQDSSGISVNHFEQYNGN